MNRALPLSLAAALALSALSCGKKPAPGPTPGASASAASAATSEVPAPQEPAGDAAHGKELVAGFECSRCHEGTGTPASTFEKQCFSCHVKIISGELKGPAGAEARWHDRVLDLKDVPSLRASRPSSLAARRALLRRGAGAG